MIILFFFFLFCLPNDPPVSSFLCPRLGENPVTLDRLAHCLHLAGIEK